MILDVGSTATIAGGKHKTGCCFALDLSNIWHRIFGETYARYSCGIREGFRKHHDYGVISQIGCSGLIDGISLLGVFLCNLGHGFFGIIFGLIHDLGMCKLEEIDGGTIAGSVLNWIPRLGAVGKIVGKFCSPGIVCSESPHEGKYECSTESGCQNARNRAGKIFNAGKRV